SSAVEHCLHTAGVTGSIPVPPTTTSASCLPPGKPIFVHLHPNRAVSSAVEHCLHTAGVTGSIPVPPTRFMQKAGLRAGFFVWSTRAPWPVARHKGRQGRESAVEVFKRCQASMTTKHLARLILLWPEGSVG